MISLKSLINEIVNKPLVVYHGTGAQFQKFDLKKSAQGIIWFTSDKNRILSKEVGAGSHGYVITAEVTINNAAGWDEYEKYRFDELQRMGYDGVILPDDATTFDCFVFNTSQIKIIKNEKV